MYVENKDGDIDGVRARIGWVTFSKMGLSVRYRGRTLKRSGDRASVVTFSTRPPERSSGGGASRFGDRNAHWAESAEVRVDDDVREELARIRSLSG
jgi:hypothetical protein